MLTFSKYMFNTVQVDALAYGVSESYEGYGISYEDVHDAINEHDISSAKESFVSDIAQQYVTETKAQ